MPKKTSTKKQTTTSEKKAPQKDLTPEIMEQLNTILDPELGIGIVDLGLVYDVKVEGKTAHVKMTLTTMGCPIGPMLIEQIETILTTMFDEIESTTTEIVWDPPWSPEKMKPEIRELMQGF